MITERSRRTSVHTVQGSAVSMLPQVLQTTIFSIAVSSAAVSGAISCSRFLIRCSAARRAAPQAAGSGAQSQVRRWISAWMRVRGATARLAALMCANRRVKANSKQLQSRRQRQASGQRLHLLLHDALGLAARVGVGRDQEVLAGFF